eukprot:4307154-Amphidinium_carterae.1
MCRFARVKEKSASLARKKSSEPLAPRASSTSWLARGDKRSKPCGTTTGRLKLALDTSSRAPHPPRTSRG